MAILQAARDEGDQAMRISNPALDAAIAILCIVAALAIVNYAYGAT